MSTELTKPAETAIDDPKGTAAHLETVMEKARECSHAELAQLGEAVKTVRIARGVLELEKLLAAKPEVNNLLTALCGHQLGFGKEPDKRYDLATIRTCAIQALLHGASLANTSGHPEWMILAGKCYLCKPYYERLLREIPEVSDVVVRCEKPDRSDASTAWVPVEVQLRFDGQLKTWSFKQTDEGDHRIGVRVNSGMLVDAIFGKAEAKAQAKVYRELSGKWLSDPPDNDGPVPRMALPDSANVGVHKEQAKSKRKPKQPQAELPLEGVENEPH